MKGLTIRPEETAPPEGVGRASFLVRADACPQLLPRIFGLLAQQDHMPESATVEVADGTLELRLAAEGLMRHRAEVLAGKIRSLIGTHSVDLAWQS